MVMPSADRGDVFPAFYISHGGGPCFDMEWPHGNPFAGLERYLTGFAGELGRRPRAILIISGHWEAERPTVTATAQPSLIYDYTDFPPHTYALRYDAPGSAQLAGRVRELLDAAGIESSADEQRGLDHGVFVPLRVMYPAADIPVVQLSLEVGYDPRRHFAIGRAVRPLRDEGVLIVGSGMSFHNLRTLFNGDAVDAERFDHWLVTAVTGDPTLREEHLARWEQAPSARAAHPEEDHLAPLFVVAGAAQGDTGRAVYRDHFLNKPIAGFRFG
jgi:aromatic ring-opening dioxygenase catalytic subunit (LigB family)